MINVSSVKLHRLILDDFKSFRGRHEIGPFCNFSSVVGANGCGKSNFMDAIMFAIGESKDKLRMHHLSDIIAHRRIDGKVICAKSTTVTLIFQDADNVEFQFSRTVKASSTAYMFQTKVVSFAEYQNELLKLNICLKFKNIIIYQGAIEENALRNPKDRTKLFEEISGSLQYKNEYDEALKEMERAQENSCVSLKIMKEMKAEKANAQSDKEDFKKYQELTELEKGCRIKLELFRLKQIETKLDLNKHEHENAEVKAKEVEAAKNSAQLAYSSFDKELKKLEKNLSNRKKTLNESEKELSLLKPQMVKVREETNRNSEKIASSQKFIENCAVQKNRIHQQMEDLVSQRDSLTDEIIASQQDISSQKLTCSQLAEFKKLSSQLRKEIPEVFIELELLNDQEKKDLVELEHIACAKNTELNFHAMIDQELEEFKARKTKIKDNLNAMEKDLLERQSTVNQSTTLVGELEDRKKLLEAELEQVSGDILINSEEQHQQEIRAEEKRKIEFLNIETYSDVIGKLSGLVRVNDKKFKLAVIRKLTKWGESFVCRTVETAQRCIRDLCAARIGKTTFLPLDYVEVEAIDEKLRYLSPHISLMIDLLDYPPEIEKAILFAVGNTLVCDSKEEALSLRDKEWRSKGKRHNIVTLDGTYFAKNGIITGGQRNLEKLAGRWDAEKGLKLETRRHQILSQLHQIHRDEQKKSTCSVAMTELKGLESRIRYAKSQLVKEEQRSKECQIKKQKRTEEFAKMSYLEKEDLLQRRIQERKHKIKKYQDRKKEKEDKIFANFCTRIGIAAIAELEKGMDRDWNDKMCKLNSLVDTINEQVVYEETRLAKVEADIKKWKLQLKDGENKKKSIAEREKKLLKQVTKQKEERDGIAGDVEGLSKELREKILEKKKLEQRALDLESTASKAARGVLACQKTRESQLNYRHSIIQSCWVASIVLPILVSDSQSSEPSMSFLEMTIESDRESSVFEHERGIKFDYDGLDEALRRQMNDEQYHVHLMELEREHQAIIDQISSFEQPNFKADDVVKNLVVKLRAASKINSDKRAATIKAMEKLEKIKKKRVETFNELLHHASSNIDGIFKAICDDQSAQAYIDIDNIDEPYVGGINYSVIYPLKRFTIMDNLSGGEKTLASLAFLFAVYNFRRSPFLLMDEIDVALDEKNIHRVARFFRLMAVHGNQQFLVVSHKESFFSYSQNLIGITQKPIGNIGSELFYLNMEEYS